MCTGLARLPGGAEATVQFKSGEGLQKDSTVDAYIQGDQAYVASFPNEVYSTIIPLLLGGAAVPVQIVWLAAVVRPTPLRAAVELLGHPVCAPTYSVSPHEIIAVHSGPGVLDLQA
jgi:hypothetical protein